MADETYSRGHRNPPGRGGTGADGPAVDPLTELARLIGQSDPFAGVDQRRANPRSAEASRPAEWPGEPSHHDHAYDDRAQDAHYAADHRDYPPEYDRQAPADPGYGYDDPHDAYTEQPYDAHADGAAARHDEGYETDPPDEHPDDPSRFYDDDEAMAPRRRGWMLTAVGLISLSIVGAAAAFAYHKVFREGAPSIIARDPGPNKIIPSSQSADSRTNKRVDRIATGGVDERMVSREEQPVPLPDTTRGTDLGQSSRIAPFTAQAQPSLPPDIATGSAGAPDGGPGPRRIQTVRVPPDTSAPNPLTSGPSAQSPLPPTPVAPRPTAPRATAAQAPTQPTPLQLAPQSTPAPPPQGGGPLSLSPQTQVATAAPPPPHARAPATAAAEAGSGYYVQVTAQRSEEEAQSSFHGIQAKYENLLGAHQPVIRKKDLGAKGIFYGAQIGPLSHDEALQLCQSLKSAGGPCMLQKN